MCGVVLNYGHSNWFVGVSHGCFYLHFPEDMWYKTYFHWFICHLQIFFGWGVYSDLFCCCFSFSYKGNCIFWLSHLFRYVFCNYFLPSCGLFSNFLEEIYLLILPVLSELVFPLHSACDPHLYPVLYFHPHLVQKEPPSINMLLQAIRKASLSN